MAACQPAPAVAAAGVWVVHQAPRHIGIALQHASDGWSGLMRSRGCLRWLPAAAHACEGTSNKDEGKCGRHSVCMGCLQLDSPVQETGNKKKGARGFNSMCMRCLQLDAPVQGTRNKKEGAWGIFNVFMGCLQLHAPLQETGRRKRKHRRGLRLGSCQCRGSIGGAFALGAANAEEA